MKTRLQASDLLRVISCLLSGWQTVAATASAAATAIWLEKGEGRKGWEGKSIQLDPRVLSHQAVT